MAVACQNHVTECLFVWKFFNGHGLFSTRTIKFVSVVVDMRLNVVFVSIGSRIDIA